jgi:uncharacterized protein (TIGR02145 family)
MRKLLFVLLLFPGLFCKSQHIGVGTNVPNSSAILDVTSTNSGLLPPRMTFEQRNLIVNPAVGLMVFCTDCDSSGQPQFFNGTRWCNMLGGSASGLLAANLPGVMICNQIFTSENLSVTRYRNGDTIPKITGGLDWQNAGYGAWCWYNNDSANYWQYGRLYNWYAVNDPRGLAPQGWHVPTDDEWTTLGTCLGGASLAGGAMKETGYTHWNSPNTGATNSSGFTGLPGGNRSSDGIFYSIGNNGRWWSASETSTPIALSRYLSYNAATLTQGSNYKSLGFSIRLIKDQ